MTNIMGDLCNYLGKTIVAEILREDGEYCLRAGFRLAMELTR